MCVAGSCTPASAAAKATLAQPQPRSTFARTKPCTHTRAHTHTPEACCSGRSPQQGGVDVVHAGHHVHVGAGRELAEQGLIRL